MKVVGKPSKVQQGGDDDDGKPIVSPRKAPRTPLQSPQPRARTHQPREDAASKPKASGGKRAGGVDRSVERAEPKKKRKAASVPHAICKSRFAA